MVTRIVWFLATSRRRSCQNVCVAGITWEDWSPGRTTRRKTRWSRSPGTKCPIEVTSVIWPALSMSPASRTLSGNPTSRLPIYVLRISKTTWIFSVTTARTARRRLTPVSNFVIPTITITITNTIIRTRARIHYFSIAIKLISNGRHERVFFTEFEHDTCRISSYFAARKV